jgi:alginate O-acetyltransferase complex protein AlgI
VRVQSRHLRALGHVFAQLVAGPIERPQNVIWQFRERHYFDYDRVRLGMQLMMWGMFKKVVIADRLAAYVNTVYNDPQSYPGISLVLATVFLPFRFTVTSLVTQISLPARRR